MKLRDLSLEMSLKPFKAHDGSDIDAILRTMFGQWETLIRQSQAEVVSIMLWTAEGSEILDYRGDPDGVINWGHFIGYANRAKKVPNDPEGVDPHSRSYLYTPNPVKLTYRRLALIISRIRAIGSELHPGLIIKVGTTFDPGPEFAISAFKYERHPEINQGKQHGEAQWVSCYSTLHGDSTRYAGFPTGIPEGLPFGSFLGRQSRHFLDDMGLDFIWFSNGFGFGIETLSATGAIFDGKEFHPDKRFFCRDKILEFWKLFRAECPKHEVRTRGTNLTTGIDLSSDGVPIGDIYQGKLNIAAPPNSPWAPLDGNFGMELAGWLSHIAELPGDDFLYRFYVHDPWWKNSPWIERYGREAHDIWLPLSMARIDETGAIQLPSRLSIITVDNSFGEMPDFPPREVTPLLLDALAHGPDAMPPAVWVYPFREYHDYTFGTNPRLDKPMAGDWLIAGAINDGLILNAVVSSTNYLSSLEKQGDLYRNSVLVTPVPDAGTALSLAIMAHIRDGGRALLYGPVDAAGEAMLSVLGLARTSVAIAGELDLICIAPQTDNDPPNGKVIHRPPYCAGSIDTVLAERSDATALTMMAPPGKPDQRRVTSLVRQASAWNGGAVAWVRGTVSASYQGGTLLTQDDPAIYARSEVLMRHAMAALGWEVGLHRRQRHVTASTIVTGANMPWELTQLELVANQDTPVVGVHRHTGAYWLSGFTRDTTTELKLRFPAGAPILLGAEAWMENGRAGYVMPRAWRRECRVLIDQTASGKVSCRELACQQMGFDRHLVVRGLQNATVTVLPPARRKLSLLVNSLWPHVHGDRPQQQPNRDGSVTVHGITGSLRIMW